MTRPPASIVDGLIVLRVPKAVLVLTAEEIVGLVHHDREVRPVPLQAGEGVLASSSVFKPSNRRFVLPLDLRGVAGRDYIVISSGATEQLRVSFALLPRSFPAPRARQPINHIRLNQLQNSLTGRGQMEERRRKSWTLSPFQPCVTSLIPPPTEFQGDIVTLIPSPTFQVVIINLIPRRKLMFKPDIVRFVLPLFKVATLPCFPLDLQKAEPRNPRPEGTDHAAK